MIFSPACNRDRRRVAAAPLSPEALARCGARVLGRTLLFPLLLAALVGCAATSQTRLLLDEPPSDLPLRQELVDVPFFPQEQYQCGPASLATLLDYSGLSVTPDELVPMVYVPERQGSFQVEMLAATRRHERLAYVIEPDLETLLRTLAGGQPVLVLQNLLLERYPQWHFAVAVGYDLPRKEIILRSGLIERYTVRMSVFERTWRRGEQWAMVTLKPGELPAHGHPHHYLAAVAAFEYNAPAEETKRAWEAGVERWSEHADLLTGYANFLYQQGEYERAVARLRQAVASQPEHAPAHNNLAWLLGEQGQREEAIALARRAVELAGEQSEPYQATLNRLLDE